MGEHEPPLRLRENAVAWKQVDGETILLDVATSTYLGVNRPGSVLWPALADGTTREQLIGRLCRAYQVSEEQAGIDVDDFLRLCRDHGLLQS